MFPLVLVVEDDPDIRDILGEVLAERGFDALVAANGREAIDAIHRFGTRPSAIVLDLRMPVMDGAEFLAAKACDLRLAGVPTVIMTAQVDRLPASLPPTVRGVLEKPVPLTVLVDMLRDMCSRSAVPPPIFARGTGAIEALARPPRRAGTHGD